MEQQSPEIKICPECGAEFECAHNANCWCMSYVIPEENLEVIKKKYSNCLCPKCLDVYQVK